MSEKATKNDIVNILASLSVNYQNFGEKTDKMKLTNLWYMALGNLPKILIQNAVLEWIVTNRYAPTVYDIKQTIYNQNTLKPYSSEELWKLILNGLSKGEVVSGGYSYAKSYDTLPKLAKELISYKEYAYLAKLNSYQLNQEKEVFEKMYNSKFENERKDFLTSPQPLELIPEWKNLLNLNNTLLSQNNKTLKIKGE